MSFNWKEFRPRNILTILAEIATILSLILAWVLYRDSQNQQTSPTQALSPVLIVFMVVNIVMFVYLSFTIIRALLNRINSKQYQLSKKVASYIKSSPEYLSKMASKDHDSLIERTKKALKNLDDNKAFDEDIYYMLLYSLFFAADGAINVVSILDDNEWVKTPEEDEFLRVNIALAEKTDKPIHLNRIFLVDENEAAKKLNNSSIQSFLEADHTYIHLFVVFKNKLSRSLINNIGSGFIEFYNFMVACDIFADNKIRGTLKTDTKEVELYNKIYMKLTEFYQPLNQEFKQQHFTSPTQTASVEVNAT